MAELPFFRLFPEMVQKWTEDHNLDDRDLGLIMKVMVAFWRRQGDLDMLDVRAVCRAAGIDHRRYIQRTSSRHVIDILAIPYLRSELKRAQEISKRRTASVQKRWENAGECDAAEDRPQSADGRYNCNTIYSPSNSKTLSTTRDSLSRRDSRISQDRESTSSAREDRDQSHNVVPFNREAR